MPTHQQNYKRNYQVKIFKLLANANRLKILELLARQEVEKLPPLNVNEMAESLKISPNNLSNHLTRLRENKVIKAQQKGWEMYYSIRDREVIKMINNTP